MKKIIVAVGLLLALSTAIFAANANSDRIKISARDSGDHAIYFSGAVPSQGCTHEDRAILVESGVKGTTALLSIAIAALINKKDVVVLVDGCTLIKPNLSLNTAPKIVKLKIFN